MVPLAGREPGSLVRRVPGELRKRLQLADEPLSSASRRGGPTRTSRALLAAPLIAAGRAPLLVLPGYPTAHRTSSRRAAELGIDDDVRFLGWLPRARGLEALYRASACSRSPPSTRASASRCWRRWRAGSRSRARAAPVLPEVAGDAALLVDPPDEQAIANAIPAELLGDAAVRERLAEAGRLRAPPV